MFYGAQSIEDVVVMDDGSRYVGAIINDRMEGFGALVKADELYIGYFHDSKPDGFLKLYKKGNCTMKDIGKQVHLTGKVRFIKRMVLLKPVIG